MTQKEYRRMVIEHVFEPLLINMVGEGMIDEFDMEEDEDDQTVIIKLKTDRPIELEQTSIEEMQEARDEDHKKHSS